MSAKLFLVRSISSAGFGTLGAKDKAAKAFFAIAGFILVGDFSVHLPYSNIRLPGIRAYCYISAIKGLHGSSNQSVHRQSFDPFLFSVCVCFS
jgi:hypothetical protein